jgi:dCMP deaminase
MIDKKLVPNKWDRRFLEAANCVSNWSPDPSSKIGALAVSAENLPLSWGWNAFPRKIISMVESEVPRETKYKYVIHAEANVIYNATRGNVSLKNSTFYVYGIPPCIECAKAIIQVGAIRVITLARRETFQRWLDSYTDSVELFREVGIISELVYETQYPS